MYKKRCSMINYCIRVEGHSGTWEVIVKEKRQDKKSLYTRE